MRHICRFLAVGVALAVLVSFAPAVHSAEKFPNKQINWYVPSGAGGGTDIFTRTAALRMRRILKVPIVITNMPGGAGARMLNFVAQKPKDGYTMFSFFSAMVGTVQRKLTKVKFEDLYPLARGTDDPQVLAVLSDSPINTIEKLIADAKANPGKQKWGMASAAGIDAVTAFGLMQAAGFKSTLVPFKSGGQVIASALGGHVQVAIANPSECGGQVESGRMKAIIAFTDKRLGIAGFKDTPTAKEKGWDLEFSNWRGVMVMKGTPPDRAKVLEKALLKSMKHSLFQNYLSTNGMPKESVTDGAKFAAFLAKDRPNWKKALKEMGFLK